MSVYIDIQIHYYRSMLNESYLDCLHSGPVQFDWVTPGYNWLTEVIGCLDLRFLTPNLLQATL